MTLSVEMQQALANPAVHDFTKRIIQDGSTKDICDVLHDLEFAQYLFKKHLNDTLKALGDKLDGRKIA